MNDHLEMKGAEKLRAKAMSVALTYAKSRPAVPRRTFSSSRDTGLMTAARLVVAALAASSSCGCAARELVLGPPPRRPAQSRTSLSAAAPPRAAQPSARFAAGERRDRCVVVVPARGTPRRRRGGERLRLLRRQKRGARAHHVRPLRRRARLLEGDACASPTHLASVAGPRRSAAAPSASAVASAAYAVPILGSSLIARCAADEARARVGVLCAAEARDTSR